VRVFVKDGSVSANVAGLVAFLLGNGGYSTGRKTSGAGSDELGKAADEFEFGIGGDEGEFVLE
jgi:hypothetical protein